MDSACCGDGSRPCGGPVAGDDAARVPVSRYPPTHRDTHSWMAAPGAAPQFESWGDDAPPPTPPGPYDYTGEHLAACNFPLGGFGTGQVILQGDGTLQSWTVVNQCRADDGGPGDAKLPLDDMPANFFALSATPAGGKQQAFALVTPHNYTRHNRALPADCEAHVTEHSVGRMQTMPGIQGLSMNARYPIAEVEYDIPGCPVTVAMEAMTPLIPNDAKNSSLPCAVFSFTISNPGAVAVEVNLMQSQQNFVGWNGMDDCTAGSNTAWGGNVNTPTQSSTLSGLVMSQTSQPGKTTQPGYGTVAALGVCGPHTKVTVIPQAANEAELWAAFAGGKFAPTTTAPTAPSVKGASYCGGTVQTVSVPAGGSVTVDFILAWHFPNRNWAAAHTHKDLVTGNMYNNWFKNAHDVAAFMQANMGSLRTTTRVFRDVVYGSTLPPDIIESAAGRLACMRSPTMWWSEKGVTLGYEGNGCCPLNCSHVYGYTTLLERLYPDLAKDMRLTDFVRCYIPGTAVGDGVSMRFGGGWAIDGALAGVIKAYLVVRQADSEAKWLPTVWPNIKAQMSIIMEKFDDGTGLIRIPQPNTYDTSMNGPNTFIGSYYVTALRSCAAMATLLGDQAGASAYAARAVLSAKNYETTCWNEDFGYYIADVTAKNCAHSYGPGCFVDQLCCIGLSSACGLGHVFDPKHEASARHQISVYNKVTQTGTKFVDQQKHFFPGDTGVTVCQYPNGKLANGMQYQSLVSTGFTSPVIAGMLLDRNMKDALEVVGWIRQRQDGRNRSPWNEPECGLWYSRSMAHWNLFDQCTGHVYDSTKAALSFDPRSDATLADGTHQFRCFTIVEGGWGEFSQTGPAGLPSGQVSLACLNGTMTLATLGLVTNATKAVVNVDGAAVAATIAGGVISFAAKTTIKTGSKLLVTLSGGHEDAEAFPAVHAIDLLPEHRPRPDAFVHTPAAPGVLTIKATLGTVTRRVRTRAPASLAELWGALAELFKGAPLEACSMCCTTGEVLRSDADLFDVLGTQPGVLKVLLRAME